MKKTLLLVAVLLSTSVSAYAEPLRVLFDEAHGNGSTLSWERAIELDSEHPEFCFFGMLDDMLAGSFALERGLQELTETSMEAFDIVVVVSPTASLADAEIDAARQFVEDGGGLLVVQQAWPAPANGGSQLAAGFGLSYREGAVCSERYDWDAGSFRVRPESSSHQIVEGIGEFQMNWGTSIDSTRDSVVLLETDDWAWQDTNGNRNRDPNELGGPLAVSVAVEVGEGRAVFISDDAFHDRAADMNRRFFQNALNWVAPQLGACAIPDFAVDSDVTLDCIVQIGDGPQELSTDIRFYPNTRRAKPGDIVSWTLELGEGSGLEPPFTIVPEMDNNMVREHTIRTDDTVTVIQHSYVMGNGYVPYVVVRASNGPSRTIWTTNLLAVVPEISQRDGVGVKLPTPESPIGDVLNACFVVLVDHRLFDRPSGRDYMTSEIQHWREVGFNLAILDIWWFVDTVSSNVLVPIYDNSPQPFFWTGTMDLENLIQITDWFHNAEMRVAWRFVLVEKGDHTTIRRFDFDPSDIELYVASQTQAKPFYAAIAEDLGVEIFGLDVENDAFTLQEESIAVVDAVRNVFSGPLFDTVTGTGARVSRSPLTPLLDLVVFSTDFHNISSISGLDDMVGSFRHQYETEFLQPLIQFQKPGLFEVFVDGQDNPRKQVDAYEAMLGVMDEEEGLVQGIAVFDLPLYPGWSNLMWTPVHRPAEGVLSNFFRERFEDQRLFDFEAELAPPLPEKVLFDFESANVWDLAVASRNGIASQSLDRTDPHEGNSSLRIDFTNENPPNDWANTTLNFYLELTQDWSQYDSLSFWHRSSIPHGGSIMVSVFDSDGDRFTTELFINYNAPDQWMPFTVYLHDLYHPSWGESGNGSLDLRHITRLEIMAKYNDLANHVAWYDSIYLGGHRK